LVFRLRDAVYAGPYAAWIPTMPPSQGVVLPNTPLKLSSAASGGANEARSVAPTQSPARPIPLAARGLAAVLARVGPAGAVVNGRPERGTSCTPTQRIRSSSWTGPAANLRATVLHYPFSELLLRGGSYA
jgi:hypothetical protein